jgi:hypothetical protein
MKAFEFTSYIEIPVAVTVEWKHEAKTTRHVEGHPAHYEILDIQIPDNLKNDILRDYYEVFQREAEGME